MRLVYFGSGAFGIPTLERLSRAHTILGVVTQPDRPAGRGAKLSPTPVAAWAAEHLPGVPIFKPAKVNEPSVIEAIRNLGGPMGSVKGAQAWVVIAFGQKLSRALLDGAFAVNLHASLLPRWRGAAPINAAILAGDTVTGNTVITLADRMDAGKILGQSSRVINPSVTAGELHDLLSHDGPELVEHVLAEFAMGNLKPRDQDETSVTIATKLAKSDGEIDFNQRADFLRRQIHALTPWPGVPVTIHTSPEQPIKILRVETSTESPQELPGRLFDARRGLVSCGHHTALRLLEVQPPGKRPMPWADFARGRTIPPGTPIAAPGESA